MNLMEKIALTKKKKVVIGAGVGVGAAGLASIPGAKSMIKERDRHVRKAGSLSKREARAIDKAKKLTYSQYKKNPSTHYGGTNEQHADRKQVYIDKRDRLLKKIDTAAQNSVKRFSKAEAFAKPYKRVLGKLIRKASHLDNLMEKIAIFGLSKKERSAKKGGE